MSSPDARTKRTLLIIAGGLLAAAIIWLIFLECSSYTRRLCVRINKFGYNVGPSDFYSRGYGSNMSIEDVLGTDILDAVECSKKCGFSADVEKKGTVELMLWYMDDDRVMVIWLVDREPELAFIENKAENTVLPLS